MTDYLALGQFVANLGVLGGVMLTLKKLTGAAERREISPQPFAVKEEQRTVSEGACHRAMDSLSSQLDDLDTKMTTRSDALRAEIKAEISTLSDQVFSWRSELVAANKAADERSEERVSAAHSRINHVAENVRAAEARIDDHLRDHRAGKVSHAG